MLLTFVCVMIVPSLAIAKQEMTIDSEGDPGDGLGATGGGGLLSNPENQDSSEAFSIENNQFFAITQFWADPICQYFPQIVLIPIWENGQLHFAIFCLDEKLGAIR
jgi:hypothetical protein